MQSPTQEPSHPEGDYLQAKATGHGNGGLFSNIGVNHHQKSMPRGRITLGRFLVFGFVMAAVGLAFVLIGEQTNNVLYAVIGGGEIVGLRGKRRGGETGIMTPLMARRRRSHGATRSETPRERSPTGKEATEGQDARQRAWQFCTPHSGCPVRRIRAMRGASPKAKRAALGGPFHSGIAPEIT